MTHDRKFVSGDEEDDLFEGAIVKACSSNWLERRTPNPEVVGSNPSRPAEFS